MHAQQTVTPAQLAAALAAQQAALSQAVISLAADLIATQAIVAQHQAFA